jgi:hypothetical protein
MVVMVRNPVFMLMENPQKVSPAGILTYPEIWFPLIGVVTVCPLNAQYSSFVEAMPSL